MFQMGMSLQLQRPPLPFVWLGLLQRPPLPFVWLGLLCLLSWSCWVVPGCLLLSRGLSEVAIDMLSFRLLCQSNRAHMSANEFE